MAYLQAKNTANQSIPNGVLTELLWPTVVTDDGGFISGGNIIIPYEGETGGGVTLEWEASAGGTYREVTLRAYDTGAEAGGYPDYMIRYEKKVCIPASATARFNRVTLVMQPYWLSMGYEVRVFAQQDSGGALNIINATTNSLLTLTNLNR